MKATFLIVMLFALMTQSVFAKDKSRHKEMAQKMKQELNLSDEQMEKIREIRKSQRTSNKELRTKLKTLREDFKQSLGNPKTSKEELLAKFTQLETLKQEVGKTRFQTMLEIRSLLDEKQIVKFHELQKSRRKNFSRNQE